MANKLNLNAETNADWIGDDSSPTITIANESSGNALKLHTASGTGVALSIVSTPTTALFVQSASVGAHVRSGASLQPALIADMNVISSPTVAVARFTQSAASGAFFEFGGFLASTASMGSIVRGIRVKYGNEYGWLPVYASATYI